MKNVLQGAIVKNDGIELALLLRKSCMLIEIRHIGDFVFEAKTADGILRIHTEPLDEDYAEIIITCVAEV